MVALGIDHRGQIVGAGRLGGATRGFLPPPRRDANPTPAGGNAGLVACASAALPRRRTAPGAGPRPSAYQMTIRSAGGSHIGSPGSMSKAA